MSDFRIFCWGGFISGVAAAALSNRGYLPDFQPENLTALMLASAFCVVCMFGSEKRRPSNEQTS